MIPAHLLSYLAASPSFVHAAPSSTSLITTRSDGKPCPVINGEALAPCGSACYSRYIYTCPSGQDLVLRPPQRGVFRLVAEGGLSSSSSSAVTGQPMTACRLVWRIGGKTCSRCPTGAPGGAPPCPAGDVAAVTLLGDVGEGSMSAEVAGGQAIYVTRDFTVGYQPAHMSTLPDGARLDKFRAFAGGGFFNTLGGMYGWAVCGDGVTKQLHVKNSTNANELKNCVGINLRVEDYDGPGAFQYI